MTDVLETLKKVRDALDADLKRIVTERNVINARRLAAEQEWDKLNREHAHTVYAFDQVTAAVEGLEGSK